MQTAVSVTFCIFVDLPFHCSITPLYSYASYSTSTLSLPLSHCISLLHVPTLYHTLSCTSSYIRFPLPLPFIFFSFRPVSPTSYFHRFSSSFFSFFSSPFYSFPAYFENITFLPLSPKLFNSSSPYFHSLSFLRIFSHGFFFYDTSFLHHRSRTCYPLLPAL